MQIFWKKYSLAVYVFLFVVFLLSFVQLKVDNPMIILELFIKGGGWLEIFFIGLFGAFIVYKMQDPGRTAKWRMVSWTIFTIVFFAQLALGLLGFEKFLMTGDLHLPIPAMIISGPLYRGELSIMTLLFLSTIIITGPAWCSQLCYFGALDNIASSRKKAVKGEIKNRSAIKFTLLFLIILITIILRWFNVDLLISTLIAALFGVIGLLIILFVSGKQGKMVHCLTWCPIGTIVSYTRFINPFRMYIDMNSCTLCNICTTSCNYDALNRKDIESGKPGITCTLCGDCVSSCHASSIKYKFFKMKPEPARRLYLFLTISLYAVFLALGRI